jgi:NADH-quinone oxidoreductase subunit N
MTPSDFQSLMPLILLAGGTIVVMLLVAIRRSHFITFSFTLLTLIASLASLSYSSALGTHEMVPLFTVDSFGLFYMGLVILATLVVTLLSYSYLDQQEDNREEYYMLLLLAALGAGVLVVSSHFISLFMGLETLTVSLYAMIAYLRHRERALEAGVKYLIMAAFSSAFLLFGMALIYTEAGSMDFTGIAEHMGAAGSFSPLMLTGMGLMVVGVGFKLGVVPFHMWTPDVYEGAPAPVTAFIATVSKGGMFAVWTRFFIEINGYSNHTVTMVFMVVAIASMFTGNILALQQKNVKRILAYSSISHLGYLLVAFLAGVKMGTEAVTFYFVAYFVTTLGAFGIVTFLSSKDRDAEELSDYKGLFWRKPFLATVCTAMLHSLAGIPLTAGFVGKFYIVAAGADAQLWALLIILVINSVIGLFYHLRIITAMYEQPEVVEAKSSTVFPLASSAALAALTILLIWFGVYPSQVMETIRSLMIM